MSAGDLRAFVLDSLALWRIDAAVSTDGDAVTVSRDNATPVTVRRVCGNAPFRWTVETAGAAPRPCPSVVVMLSALRAQLGGDAVGARLRIASPIGP